MIHIHVSWALKYLPNTVRCLINCYFSGLTSSKTYKELETIPKILYIFFIFQISFSKHMSQIMANLVFGICKILNECLLYMIYEIQKSRNKQKSH